MKTIYASALASALGFSAAPALAGSTQLDFSGLAHASVVTDQVDGVTISAINPNNSLDAAIVWDYQARPDLAPGGHFGPSWAGGNLPSSTIPGNGVTLLGTGSATLEIGRPAGTLVFDFDKPITSFGFTAVDVEGPEEFQTDSGFFVDFFSNSVEVGTVFFGDLLTPGSQFFDPTIEFGNATINEIGPFLASEFDVDSFDSVAVSLGGSATLTQITSTPVPSPTAVLGGMCLMGCLAARRRRVQD